LARMRPVRSLPFLIWRVDSVMAWRALVMTPLRQQAPGADPSQEALAHGEKAMV
jgi:hypothetical protein